MNVCLSVTVTSTLYKEQRTSRQQLRQSLQVHYQTFLHHHQTMSYTSLLVRLSVFHLTALTDRTAQKTTHCFATITSTVVQYLPPGITTGEIHSLGFVGVVTSECSESVNVVYSGRGPQLLCNIDLFQQNVMLGNKTAYIHCLQLEL